MKKTICITLALCLAVLMAACSMPTSSAPAASVPADTNEASTAPAEAGSTAEALKVERIGYAAAGLNSEYNMMVYDELTAACEKEGVTLETQSCEGDVSLQVQQVENFITQDVDALIVFPVDPATLYDVMKKAMDAGIWVVVGGGYAMEPGSYSVSVACNEYDMGITATQMAADWIDETFPDAAPGTVKCAVLGVWYSETSAIRCDIMCEIEDYTDKAVLVETYDIGLDNFSTITGEYTEVLLQNHPDINCILSFSDTLSILADEVILQKSGLDMSKIGQFTIDRSSVGFERIQASARDESTLRGTAVPGMFVAQDLLDACLGRLNDQLDESLVFEEEIVPITVANVDDYL